MEETPVGLVPEIVALADLTGRPTGGYGIDEDLDDYEYQQRLYEV